MRRLRAVEEEVVSQDEQAPQGKTRVVREPVLKTRKPMFLEKKRVRKFLLKKY